MHIYFFPSLLIQHRFTERKQKSIQNIDSSDIYIFFSIYIHKYSFVLYDKIGEGEEYKEDSNLGEFNCPETFSFACYATMNR